jgi:hypothetical protein
MAIIQYPLINGVRHSFSSIEGQFVQAAAVGGQGQSGSAAGAAMALNFRGYKAINYGRTRSRTFVYGTHPDPIGKTRGKNEYKADLEVLLAEFYQLQDALQAIQAGYGDVFFQFIVTYSENGFDTKTDTIIGCTLDLTEASQAEGTDALHRKISLSPLKILINGIDDCAIPLAPLPGS